MSWTDVTLVLLRLILGVTIGLHGLAHVRHFGSYLEGAVARFNLRPRRFWALVNVVAQLLGGALVVLGLATPAGAALVASSMWMPFLMRRRTGFWDQQDGYEYPMFIGVVALAVAVGGGGRLSLDHLLGLQAFFARPAVFLSLLAAGFAFASLAWATRGPAAPSAAPSGSSARAGAHR